MTHGLPSHPALADGPVYLDHNATTPVDPQVAEAMLPHLTDFFGNPSSSHPYGAEPKAALAGARWCRSARCRSWRSTWARMSCPLWRWARSGPSRM